jgi:uncharacterized integral membrane protein
MMQKIRWAILILGIIVLMTAMIQNSAPVTLTFLVYKAEMPTSILLLVTSVASFLAGAITTGRILRRRDATKKLANSLEKPTPAPTPPATERKNPLT